MKPICLFKKELRKCPFINNDETHCDAPEPGCGFRKEVVQEDTEKGYKREPRWYEKYYK